MTAREFAVEVVRRLQANGYQALWAGGCVRDELLGLAPADYDVATDARPEQVKAIFRRCVEVGVAFGVVEVIGPRDEQGEWLSVQVATFRSDGHYSDGRRPDCVTYSSAREDALRRDFTINGMFFNPITGEIIDYVGGRADLAARVLRAIGDPVARLGEDKLRILRAVRMAARFELTIEPSTAAAVRMMANQIRVVSVERIADELRKIFANRHRCRGAELLDELGLLPPILPEVPTVPRSVLAGLPETASFPLGFAALLIAVPPKTVAAIGRRLKLANDEIARLEWLVRHQAALRDAASLRPSQRHPFLTHPGIPELLALHRALGWTADADFCENLLRTTPREQLDPPPVLTGDDLVALGWKPGPHFRQVLDDIRRRQLDGEVQSREQALRQLPRSS